MRRLADAAVVALGVTTIYLLWMVSPLVSPNHATVFHWSGQPSVLFLPVILDFCLFWVVMTLCFAMAQRPGRVRVALWTGLIFSLPWIALKNWSLMSGQVMPHRLSVAIFGISLAATLLTVVLWRSDFQPFFEPTVRFTATLLRFAAISGVVVLIELAWLGWEARSLNTGVAIHPVRSVMGADASKPRIIWIVLDELSYQQVYERRFAGLDLGAFDQLAGEATVFTHVIPAGNRTERVMPSLMTGQPVDEVRSSADGQLSIHNPDLKTWVRFDQHATVFQDALNAGYSPSVAGWYIPYCRILPAMLDHCSWIFSALAQNLMLPEGSVRSNMLQPLQFVAGSGLARQPITGGRRIPESSVFNAAIHASEYRSLVASADDLLEDRSASFVLVHMPIPHPPGFYDRRTGEFGRGGSSYIDNLALADKYLAHVWSLLQKSDQWDHSAVVIMGDHSWRTKLIWTSNRDWTEEEQIASHGGEFDERPAYIVKLPNQHAGSRIDITFAAVNTRKLLDGIMSGRISSAQALSSWVADAGLKH